MCVGVTFLSWGVLSEAGSISSELLMCAGGAHSILLLPLVARYIETIDVCIWHMFVCMSVVVRLCVGLWECMLCSGRC